MFIMTNLGGGEDVLDGLGDLRTNAITLDQGDKEVALCNRSVYCRVMEATAKHRD